MQSERQRTTNDEQGRTGQKENGTSHPPEALRIAIALALALAIAPQLQSNPLHAQTPRAQAQERTHFRASQKLQTAYVRSAKTIHPQPWCREGKGAGPNAPWRPINRLLCCGWPGGGGPCTSPTILHSRSSASSSSTKPHDQPTAVSAAAGVRRRGCSYPLSRSITPAGRSVIFPYPLRVSLGTGNVDITMNSQE